MRGCVTRVTRVVLVIATRAMTVKIVTIRSVENGQDPLLDDLEQGDVGPASWSVGTVSAAAMDTST
jgi:hypothetical protein